MSSRRAVGLLLLVLALVLTFVAFGSPSFTWGNEGVRVQHPWAQAVAAFGAALALAGAAFGFERPAPRVALRAALPPRSWAFPPTTWPGASKRSRRASTSARLRGAVSLSWNEIVAVEPSVGAVTLRSRSGKRLVIGTSRFEPDERVRLERTIARRVKEAAIR